MILTPKHVVVGSRLKECACVRQPASPPPCSALSLLLRVCRHCNVATMDDEARGNGLTEKVTEYCIHGHFKRSEGDARGLWGAWWLPTRVLVKQLGREVVEEAIKAFQAALVDDLNAVLQAAEADSDEDQDV